MNAANIINNNQISNLNTSILCCYQFGCIQGNFFVFERNIKSLRNVFYYMVVSKWRKN